MVKTAVLGFLVLRRSYAALHGPAMARIGDIGIPALPALSTRYCEFPLTSYDYRCRLST